MSFRRIFALIVLFVSAALAQAPGNPEHVLADIDINRSKIADIEKLYGQPDAIYGVPAPYPAGTKEYRWQRLTLTLKVLSQPAASGDEITAIQIEGEGDAKAISRTGRGLKLRDKSKKIEKLYGVVPTGPEVALKWSDGTTLEIRLNEDNRISRLELIRSK